jgi:putative DNA primase/helicase
MAHAAAVSVEDVLARLAERTGRAPKANGKGYEARCPAHTDERESLSVSDGERGILLHCHAGCDFRTIASALGYSPRDLFHDADRPSGPGKLEAKYVYTDEAGVPLFEVRRYRQPSGKKTFLQYKPDGTSGVKGIRRPLYRLPQVMEAAAAGRTVFWVEGEKCVHALLSVGLDATCTAGGADGRIPQDAGVALEGAKVVVLPDHDEPGRKYAARVSAALGGRARVVDLPGLADGEDVVEWLAAGNTAEALLALAAASPPSNVIPLTPKRRDPPPPDPLIEQLHLTDLGNAERMLRDHGADLRYCHPWKRWLVWDGRRYAMDDSGAVVRRAKQTVRQILAEASELDDSAARKATLKHATQSEAAKKIDAMIALLRSESGIPVAPGELDADPWLLTVANGVLDLRTGELSPHHKALLTTKLVPIPYQVDAPCPTWKRFLLEAMKGREELVAYLQRAMGYSLTGVTTEHVMFVLHGDGRNGKSTFIEILRLVSGEYARAAPMETFLVGRNDGDRPRNDLAALKGARVVTSVEVPEGRRLDEAFIKAVTGGDTVSCRFLHGEFFDMVPLFKLWLATNYKPEIRGTDVGIWSRLQLVPWEESFAGREDRDLPRQIREELPGILAWIVDGALDWREGGLRPPSAVAEATKAYRAEMDVVQRFVMEKCVLEKNTSIRSSDLYRVYVKWSEANGEKPKSHTAFGKAIKKVPGVTDRTSGVVILEGIRLLTAEEERERSEHNE